jgi:hypothetical protein
VVESSALLKRRTPKGYRGFESLPHRHLSRLRLTARITRPYSAGAVRSNSQAARQSLSPRFSDEMLNTVSQRLPIVRDPANLARRH